jgi:hypothetical protein
MVPINTGRTKKVWYWVQYLLVLKKVLVAVPDPHGSELD